MNGKPRTRCFHSCHGNRLGMVLAHQNEALLLAITVGDLDQVKRLVGHGVTVNTRQRTALSVAIEEEQTEIANFLICNGADVNFVDSLGVPPLVTAVRSGNLEAVRMLIEAGADVNGRASLQKRTLLKSTHTTPLHVAAAEEDVDLLNTLLASNGDVNMKNAKLETPLHLAAHSGHKVNITRLVACGAAVDHLDRLGCTPLHHAISEGHADCVKELCRLGSSVNFPTSEGYTPLMLAVNKFQLEALKTVLQFEPSINRREGHLERTVVHTVIETCTHRGNNQRVLSVDRELEVLDCLVRAGADVNVADRNQDTPLHLCVQIGCEALLNYLIHCDSIDVNKVDFRQRTALMKACSMDGNDSMIRCLIQYCPLLVNSSSTTGGVMAQLAAVNNLPSMQLLLEAGYKCSWGEADLCRQIQPNNTAILNFIHEQILQPSPLLRLCLASVRNCMGVNCMICANQFLDFSVFCEPIINKASENYCVVCLPGTGGDGSDMITSGSTGSLAMVATNPKKLVEFYYDVISPYSWIGFELLCRYKNKWNIDVKWKPFFLGGIMHASGNKPPGQVPYKAMYMQKELELLGKYYKIPLRPISDPVGTLFQKGSLSTMRFITAVDLDKPELTEELSRCLWMRIWNKDQDITETASLIAAAKDAGISEADAKRYVDCIKEQKIKDRLKQYTDEALKYNAFGSPTIIVEDQNHVKHMIFGSDRMHVIAMILGEKYEGPLLEYAKSRL